MPTTASVPPAEDFAREGFVAPCPILDPAEAERHAGLALAALGVDPAAPGPARRNPFAWHHRWRWAYDLATHPRLLDRVEAVLGQNLVLWAMACWYKEPGNGKPIPWHQDTQYWPMEPTTTVSAWIALTETTRENGCLRVIAGSHRTRLEHHAMDGLGNGFASGVDGVDESQAADLEMRPGEVTLFSEATLHGSGPNRTARPRLGISLRYSPPSVRFLIGEWGDAGRIRTFLVRGEDPLRLNEGIRGEPPRA
jgi:ectoine hydroxylase-related dioxygenase (phytanoyl-CoA dioxygenase family)